MKAPFLDLGPQYREIKEELDPQLDELFIKLAFVLSPYVGNISVSASFFL